MEQSSQNTKSKALFAAAASSFFAVCCIFLGGCGSSSTPFNISGNWFVYHTTNGATAGDVGPTIMVITQTNKTLTGTTSDGYLMSGSVSHTSVTFSWNDASGATITYTGSEASDGATMSGTWSDTNGFTGTWHALIDLPTQISIAGSWSVVNTPANGTPSEPQALGLTEVGNALSGTGPNSEVVTGSAAKVDATFSWIDAGNTTHVYTGAVDSGGTSITGGYYEVTTGGDVTTGTWTASALAQ